MVKNAWDYRWSSVHAHLAGKDANGIVQADKLISLVGDWRAYLNEVRGLRYDQGNEFEQHERTGRPLGEDSFIEKAERLLKRELKKKKPGPKGGEGNN